MRCIEAVPVESMPRPVVLQFELTSACNLRCRMCPLTSRTSSTSHDPGPMTETTWARLRQAAAWVGRAALAGYGEPLTDPSCLQRLEELDDDGVVLAMATNGTRVTAEAARRLAALRHLLEVNVSIDAADPDAYRRLRRGSLHRALLGVRLLSGALHPHQVLVSAVLLDDTAATWASLPDLLQRLGVRRLAISASHDYNDFSRERRATPDNAPVVHSLRTACEARGIAVELSNPIRTSAELRSDQATMDRYFVDASAWDPTRTRQCFVPWEAPFVDKDGRVFPCCFAAAADEHRLGDLADGLEAVWSGVAFRRFRDDLVDGRTTPDVCRRCTTVPLGPHPYADWRAELVDITTRRTGLVELRYRNVGTRTWTRSQPVRVGSSRPHDTMSTLRTDGWLSPNRAVATAEAAVPPGAIATFRVPVAARGSGYVALVADGHCWLPGTDVRITARRSLRRWSRPSPSA